MIAAMAWVVEHPERHDGRERSGEASPVLQSPIVIGASAVYLALLFAVAYWGDKRADEGRSVIANPTIYALSMAVYCTTWTYYGSVGRAAVTGVGFLPIYLGPTLVMALGGFLLLKMIRTAKANRITSIADFIASRYGKSQLLGGLVTVIAVIGIVPYIALQLKAVASSYDLIVGYPALKAVVGVQRAGSGGYHVLDRADPRGLHHPLRDPPSRCDRTPRGHGRRRRARVGRQAACLRCRWPVRDLWPL